MAKGPRASVRRDRLVEAPHLAWSAFVDLLSTAHYAELSPVQRVAFLVFLYDREVKTGGHRRYLRSHGTQRLAETSAALARLGADGHRGVLERAGAAGVGEDSAEVDRLDDDFHGLRPDLHVRLEAWLAAHRDEFLSFEE